MGTPSSCVPGVPRTHWWSLDERLALMTAIARRREFFERPIVTATVGVFFLAQAAWTIWMLLGDRLDDRWPRWLIACGAVVLVPAGVFMIVQAVRDRKPSHKTLQADGVSP